MDAATNSTYGVKTTVESAGQSWTAKTGAHASEHEMRGNSVAGADYSISSVLRNDQFASLVLGGIGMILLMRRFFVYFALLLTSGYLLYRGLGCQPALAQDGSRESDTPSKSVHTDGPHARATVPNSTATFARKTGEDGVEEALRETFPASDPPANW